MDFDPSGSLVLTISMKFNEFKEIQGKFKKIKGNAMVWIYLFLLQKCSLRLRTRAPARPWMRRMKCPMSNRPTSIRDLAVYSNRTDKQNLETEV
jgi:hypothetical protein